MATPDIRVQAILDDLAAIKARHQVIMANSRFIRTQRWRLWETVRRYRENYRLLTQNCASLIDVAEKLLAEVRTRPSNGQGRP